MKNLILTCMALFLVFLFGCQESSITDPSQQFAEDQNKDANHSDWFQDRPDDRMHNIIGLKYQLTDPSTGVAYILNGLVEYENTFLPFIDDARKVWVKVGLKMSSQLSFDMASDHPVWKIEKKTEDNVLFTATGSATKELNKIYSITNRRDIELRVTYLISFKAVKVTAISLRPRKNYITDDDATN